MLIQAHLTGADGNRFIRELTSVADTQQALLELLSINRELKRRGVPCYGLEELMRRGYRYFSDPGEQWLNIAQLNKTKRGDCEDYSAAIACADEELGAEPYCFQASNKVIHCVVRYPNGKIVDPSAFLGMKLPNTKGLLRWKKNK